MTILPPLENVQVVVPRNIEASRIVETFTVQRIFQRHCHKVLPPHQLFGYLDLGENVQIHSVVQIVNFPVEPDEKVIKKIRKRRFKRNLLACGD